MSHMNNYCDIEEIFMSLEIYKINQNNMFELHHSTAGSLKNNINGDVDN